MTLVPYLAENPDPTESEIRHALSGNLCRCTGYQHIVDAALRAAELIRPPPHSPDPSPTLKGGEGRPRPFVPTRSQG